MVPAEAVARFRADLEKLTVRPPEKFGVAVSGGADSLALLLLAAAAYPGQVEAATVDHGLRGESPAEAKLVADLCLKLGVRHDTLVVEWPEPPRDNLQARARKARYEELTFWACCGGFPYIVTGHHLDDQAETMLMRLARGAGVSGLSGVRRTREMDNDGDWFLVARPLLSWRKHELAALVEAAGLHPVYDQSNHDERFDRTRVRSFLASAPWLDPVRLAASASHLAEAEEALDWAVQNLAAKRIVSAQGGVTLDHEGLPRELKRRLLLSVLSHFIWSESRFLPGPKVDRLLEGLIAGQAGTLAGVRALPGNLWHFEVAPPRRAAPR